MTAEIDPKNIVGSIIKASRLLNLYSVDRREISLGEFAVEAGYNKTTTYRLLQTLVTIGWLIRSTSGGYRLGTQMLVLGAVARADLNLRNEAMPFMKRIADELGDTAFLMVPWRHGAIVIEIAVGDNPVQVHGLAVGSVLPYHAAAGPVAIAAFSPKIETALQSEENEKFTAQTITTGPELRARFATVRELGYSVSMEDYIDGVGAVGAPIRDAAGEAVGSLSVGGPAHRFTSPQREHAIKLICSQAAELSAQLGC